MKIGVSDEVLNKKSLTTDIRVAFKDISAPCNERIRVVPECLHLAEHSGKANMFYHPKYLYFTSREELRW